MQIKNKWLKILWPSDCTRRWQNHDFYATDSGEKESCHDTYVGNLGTVLYIEKVHHIVT